MVNAAQIQLRHAQPEDADEICRLLTEGYQRPINVWRPLFDYSWKHSPDSTRTLGTVMADGNKIVGFLSCVTANRDVNGGEQTFCNLNSWYVRKEYQSFSGAMIKMLLRQKNIHFTTLTPAKHVAPILSAFGFKFLNEHKLILLPFMNLSIRQKKARILTKPSDIETVLSSQQRRIYDDHRPFDCRQQVLVDNDGYSYVVTKRKFFKGKLPYSMVLYCSNKELFGKHLEQFKLSTILRDRTLGLIVEPRYLLSAPRGAIKLQRPTFYRSGQLSPEHIDGLYSELVLLPL